MKRKYAFLCVLCVACVFGVGTCISSILYDIAPGLL